MNIKDHHKHPKLARPSLGTFGRNEWAILGAPCSKIQLLAKQVIQRLSKQYQCAYIDAEHLAPEMAVDLPGMLAVGAAMEYTDAIQYRQLTAQAPWDVYQNRAIFNLCDLVLVNGNHHTAAAQVVIIDTAKADSLRRRLDQLTNVRLILLAHEDVPIFDFLEESLPEIGRIPRLMLEDVAGITHFFEQALQHNNPLLNGLVLAGGHSIRMGRDKGAIEWHGKPQRDYLVALLRPVCSEVFISCRPEQADGFQAHNPTVADTFIGLGPLGALLSAFRAQPDRAWLVVACDLPLLDQATIDFLVQHRCVKKIATAFQSPVDHLPEPLITIWEPKAYAVLLSFLAQGYSCPRKVLINSDTHLLTATDPDVFQNVNTPEDMERIIRRKGSGGGY